MLKIRFTPKGFLKILTFSPSNICIAVRERVLIFYSILKYMYSSFEYLHMKYTICEVIHCIATIFSDEYYIIELVNLL